MPKPSASRKRAQRISILLADDHPIVREGVRAVLERHPEFRVVASVSNGSEALEEAERLKPDVVVMDISMPRLNGIDATRAIAGRQPNVAVLMLSMHSSPLIVRRALDAGARGYLLKDTTPKEVVQAVKTVAAGKTYFPQGLSAETISQSKRVRNDNRSIEALTAPELRILKLVAEGRSNPQIAAAIGLTRRTVETYRLRLMRKLGLESLASLVHYAIRHGIVPLE